MHDMSTALIAPVPGWYRKPTPWWIDSFKEVHLLPIVETDKTAEEEEDMIYEQEEPSIEGEEPEAEIETLSTFAVVEPTREGMAIWSLYMHDFINVINMTRYCV